VAPDQLAPGTLLIAAPGEDADALFGRTVVLVVDREPNGISVGIALNRPLERSVVDVSALALLFVSEPAARAYWGGPMGEDPAVLAQLSRVDGLEWFHLPTRQRRPFPLPDVGLISVGEHPEPFESRVVRARLYVGLCVWAAGQLEAEVDRRLWLTAPARIAHLFSPNPEQLWAEVLWHV
jgi:putative AlgH/UPF0301 family transcriptional regulator